MRDECKNVSTNGKCCGSFWTDSCFILSTFGNGCIYLSSCRPIIKGSTPITPIPKGRQGAECDDSSCPKRMSPQRHLLLPFLAKLDSEHIRSTVQYFHFKPRWSWWFLSKGSKEWSFIRVSSKASTLMGDAASYSGTSNDRCCMLVLLHLA